MPSIKDGAFAVHLQFSRLIVTEKAGEESTSFSSSKTAAAIRNSKADEAARLNASPLFKYAFWCRGRSVVRLAAHLYALHRGSVFSQCFCDLFSKGCAYHRVH